MDMEKNGKNKLGRQEKNEEVLAAIGEERSLVEAVVKRKKTGLGTL